LTIPASRSFFTSPVLVRAVRSLHVPLGLRRTGCDDTNAQLRAHAPELRDRRFSAHPLLRVRRLRYTFFQSV